MIGLLLVSHGNFAKSLLESAELITGKQKNTKTLSLNYGDNISELTLQINKAINELNKNSEVLVLTDLLGGSPSNATAVNMEKIKFKCITGVNLPMLIEAILSRSDENLSLDEVFNKSIKAGRDGIKDLGELLCIKNND